jgi:hypothetical protein
LSGKKSVPANAMGTAARCQGGEMRHEIRALFVVVAAVVLGLSSHALADSAIDESFTIGPAPLNSGLPYYGNNLDAEIQLLEHWQAKAAYLISTDELELVHNTFQLGATWDPTGAVELSSYGFYSPYVAGTAVVQVPQCHIAGGGNVNIDDQLGSGSFGFDLNGSYQIGPNKQSLTLMGDVSGTNYQINQTLTPPYCGGTKPAPANFNGTLNQVGLNLGIKARLGNTKVSLSGTYYLYDQNPAVFGQISLRGIFPVSLGGLASGAAGLPTSPMVFNVSATIKQRLLEKLNLGFTYGFMQYVGTNGTGDAFTPKVSYDFTDLVSASVSYTLQLQFSPTPPTAIVGPGQPPSVSNSFTGGLTLNW